MCLEIQESLNNIESELNKLTKLRYIFNLSCIDYLFSDKVYKKYTELNANIELQSTTYDSNIKKLETFLFAKDNQKQIEKVGCSSLWL